MSAKRKHGTPRVRLNVEVHPDNAVFVEEISKELPAPNVSQTQRHF